MGLVPKGIAPQEMRSHSTVSNFQAFVSFLQEKGSQQESPPEWVLSPYGGLKEEVLWQATSGKSPTFVNSVVVCQPANGTGEHVACGSKPAPHPSPRALPQENFLLGVREPACLSSLIFISFFSFAL